LELADATLTSKVATEEKQLPKLPDDPLERGRTIRTMRIGLDVSQLVFAERVGIRFSTFTQIEGGAGNPTPQMLQRIAKELGCEP
jgi:DNA-binding transcriptional regulator YiaG